MTLALSKSIICSYCGDIVPLHLGFDSERHNELAKADIKWESDSDAVFIRTFSGKDDSCFNHGVLLVLKKTGVATVTARYENNIYSCLVTVREARKAQPNDELDFYIGDLHNHTTQIHSHNEYINRTSEFQYEFINRIKSEGKLDFCAMSDHAIVLNDTEFFRNFLEVEKAEPNSVIMFPGAESEVTVLEKDRFGIVHKNAGEIVTFNTDCYDTADSWERFYRCFDNSPEPVAIFAHPAELGISTKGVWNFCFHKNNTKEMINAARGIEVINGRSVKTNLMHEFSYSLALDSGFHVSPIASSDCHGPQWGYGFMKAKTVLMAFEKSREAFIDALRNNRFYATESGNVKLKYSVNGKTAPATLDSATVYSFHVEVSTFDNDSSTLPKICSVISDGGKTLLTLKDIEKSFDFEITSISARYFYLRLTDNEGNRTWSMPVWTGRQFDNYTHPMLTPVDLQNATAVDILTGCDASAAINGDVYDLWEAQSGRASIVIDMKDVHTLRAVGNYPRILAKPSRLREPELWKDWREDEFTSSIPTDYAVYTSLDGKNYQKQSAGVFRMFGGETLVTFEPTKARYVRFDVLSTVGNSSLPHLYGNAKCTVANITLFE